MVVIGGYDAPMEEPHFFCTLHASSRGYSVAVFDGPGRGGTLLEYGMKMSHNFDEILASVFDMAAEYGRRRQTTEMGLSLGGLLCLKAISGANTSSRVHAVAADPAELDLLDAFPSRLPFPQSVCERLPESPAWAVWLVGVILGNIAGGQSVAGWAIRRGMLVHNYNSPIE